MTPPPGPQVGGMPPPDGNRNLGPALVGINWGVFAPSWILVALRLVTRIWISHNFGWDDATILFAQCTNTVGIGFVMMEVFWGLGQHKFYLATNHLEGYLKFAYMDWIQVFVTLCTSKISICLFLLRISKFEKWRNFLYGVIAFLIITHVPLTILFIIQCRPVQAIWNMERQAKCFSKETIERIIIAQGSFSIISDVILAAFPILLLRNTRLKFKTKVALNALMGLGIVTAIVCIIRTAFSYEVKNTEDPTWDGIPNALCRMLEVNFGIIASCMPMIRTFYIWAKRRLRQARNSESIPSTRTPLSQLEWYHPPTDKPWYHRLRHTLFRRPDPPFELSPSSSQQSVPKVPSKSRDHDEEKDTQHGQQQQRQRIQLKHQPRSIPPPPKAKHKQAGKYTSRAQRARHYDRPANATWAKEDSQPRSYSQPRESLQPKKSESLDLPLQGPRKSEYGNEYGGGSGDFGGFEYHRGKSLK